MNRLRSLGPSDADTGLLHEAMAGVGYSSLSSSPGARLGTGLKDVDRVTGGGLSAGIHLVSGEPGSGRTGLAVTLALHAAQTGHAVLAVCKDDDSLAFAQRLVSGHTRIDRAKLVNNVNPHPEALDPATQHLADLPILVAESEGLELWSIGWALRELAVTPTDRPTLLIIDDLDQLTASDNQPSLLRQVGRSLDNLARSLAVTLIVITAVRPATHGGNRQKPTLQDANGWDSLSHYLRTAWLVYRDEMRDDNSPDRGIGELALAWHANGPTGAIKLAYLPHLGIWANLHPQAPA